MEALSKAGHEVIPIGITKSGRWLAGGDPMAALLEGGSPTALAATLLAEPGQRSLRRIEPSASSHDLKEIDVVFPVLHGTYGEDGTVQGLLDLADIPYVGTGVLASSVGMDKIFVKTYWRGLGFPQTDWVATSRRAIESNVDAIIAEVEAKLGYPCFTKPANLGSSVGVSKARTRDELRAGLVEAARYDASVLVEEGVDPRELEVAVLGNEEPEASVVGEIVANADFYSYRAKYLEDGSVAVIPADLPEETSNEIRRLAVEAFKSIHGTGLARADFFLDRQTGKIYLNELNTMPGFTSISMYPKLWEATGVPYAELVDRLVNLAVERHAERSRNETSFDGAQ
jgi:D-alanine-D-alanine ligase